MCSCFLLCHILYVLNDIKSIYTFIRALDIQILQNLSFDPDQTQ